jgi:hypothetical protein
MSAKTWGECSPEARQAVLERLRRERAYVESRSAESRRVDPARPTACAEQADAFDAAIALLAAAALGSSAP